LKVVSDFLYPIVIAVSAVTTFTTPYLIRYSDPLYTWIEKRLPQKFLDRMNVYERAMASTGKESAFALLWRTYGLVIMINTVVVLGIAFSISTWALPILVSTFSDSSTVRFLACVVTLLACSPFLYALVFRVPSKLSSEK